MKTRIKNLFLLPALIAGVGLIPAGRVTAQTFTTLHSFTATPSSPPYTNNDGGGPFAGLILSGNILYGTANGGGSLGWGTVFAINTDGTGFTNLHSFLGPPSEAGVPFAGLVLSGNTLYGTTQGGGSSGNGAVFKVNIDGTGFTNLHSFTGSSDGAFPRAGLILLGSTLYGTAELGGSSGNGTVFAVNTNGTGFTNLHSFTGSSDGDESRAGLVLSGSTLYGTTSSGGSNTYGTVFKVNTDGTGFTNLHSFIFSSDGSRPAAGLILSSGTLYGTAENGGSSGRGTVFKVNTDGTGFTNLHSFDVNDGGDPRAGLVLSGSTLYGTAQYGGSSGGGTVFAINTDGTGFTNLYSFTQNNVFPYTNSDGVAPLAGLILSGNTLYGTASGGGSSGSGTVFSLSLPPPQLTIIRSGANVILTWPTAAAGFTLQSAPASIGTYTNLPAATSPYTNPIAGDQQFFRLISN